MSATARQGEQMEKMQKEIQKMTAAPGILAACCREGDEVVLDFARSRLPLSGEDRARWSALIDAARNLLTVAMAADARPGVNEIRLVLDHHTVLVHAEGSLTIAVVFLKGDSVVKSLPRMVRKAFRNIAKQTAPARQVVASSYDRTPEETGSLP